MAKAYYLLSILIPTIILISANHRNAVVNALQDPPSGRIRGGKADDSHDGRHLMGGSMDIRRTIHSLRDRVLDCKYCPNENKEVCFDGNEEGENGLFTCDPSTSVFDEIACSTRIIGLVACLGNGVVDLCNLQDLVEELWSQTSEQYSVLQNGPSVDSMGLVGEYALDDETYTNMLSAAGLSKEVLRDSYNQAVEKAIEEGSVDAVDSKEVAVKDVNKGNRQLAFHAGVVAGAHLSIAILNFINLFFSDGVNDTRAAFTKYMVDWCWDNYSSIGWQCVISNGYENETAQHRARGGDYEAFLVECPTNGGTYYYTLFFTRIGKPFYFDRYGGEPGYVNWAYRGYFNRIEHSYYHREIRTIEWNHGAFGYEHSYYSGQEIHFPAGRFDWGSFPNDFISSIQVDWCHELIVYEHTRFSGKARVWRGEVSDPWIGYEWNDEISSVIVNRIC